MRFLTREYFVKARTINVTVILPIVGTRWFDTVVKCCFHHFEYMCDKEKEQQKDRESHDTARGFGIKVTWRGRRRALNMSPGIFQGM